MKEKTGRFRDLSDGISRDTRIRPMLDPAGVSLDDSGPEQLTAALVHFAKHLNYYQSQPGRPGGNWEDLFMRDELVVMSLAMAYDLKSFSDRFFSGYNQTKVVYPRNKKVESLQSLCRLLIDESRILNNWFVQLQSVANHTRFYPELLNFIENKLSVHLQYLIELDKRTVKFLQTDESAAEIEDVTAHHFHNVWSTGRSGLFSETGDFAYDELNAQLNRVRSAYYDLSDAFYHLRKLSKELIPVSLQQNDHLPHVALLHTFVRLFEHNRAELNQIPGRHLEHYYFNVLKIKPRPVVPDHTVVVFQLAEHTDEYLLPKNTVLLAEKNEDGSFNKFLTDEDIVLNKIRVASVKTLFAGRGREIYTATQSEVVNKIEAMDVLSDGNGWTNDISWPTFGYTNTNTWHGERRQYDAESGFAVSSFLLQMQQGEREVKLDLECEPGSASRLMTLLNEVAEETKIVAELTNQELSDLAEVLNSLELSELVKLAKTSVEFLKQIPAHKKNNRSTGIKRHKLEKLFFQPDGANPEEEMAARKLSDSEIKALATLLSRLSEPQLESLGERLSKLHENEEKEKGKRARHSRHGYDGIWKHLLRFISSILNMLMRLLGFGHHTKKQRLKEKEDKTATEMRNKIEQLTRISADRIIDTAFYKVFTNAFNLEITTPEGWSQIQNYMLSPPENDNGIISVHFNVPPSFPAIVNYNPDVHARKAQQQFNTRWPVLRITINERASIYPYSFLSKLELKRINLTVHVDGLRNLDLANQNGPLSGAQPFTPFGSVPVSGSYLLVGNNEVFCKSLSRLELSMEWQGLPTQQFGFTEYYKGYPDRVVNESFRCRVSVLNNFDWVPKQKTEQQEIILFRSRSPFALLPDYAVEPVTVIDYLDAAKLQLPASYQDTSGSLLFSNDLRRGFIKLELCNPPMAFGHDIYPTLLSESIIRKAKNKETVELNKPYTPVISTITLNYSSSHDLNFKTLSKEDQQQGAFFHIHPFGVAEINPSTTSQSIYLLPQLDQEGGLYIGLADVHAPETVSLFFHLHEKRSSSSDNAGVLVRWSYLCQNEWKVFHDSRILKDDTSHFIKSGIVMIELPDDINNDNSTMPAGLFWIRAEVEQESGNAADTVCIYTQAVGITRKLNGNPGAPTVLAENTITTLEQKVAAIAGISQPLKSTGGLPAEQSGALYTRISERLRHKQRISTPKDYEQMVLEKFPSIFKVKCVMTRAHVSRGGIVRVVVLPDVYSSNNVNIFEPKADAWELEQIRQYLQQYAAPFTRIQVMNTEFERLKVMGKVRFEKGYNNGYFIQKLEREIQEYLTPWMGKGNSATRSVPAFGEPVNRQNLLSFVESLPYVEQVTEFGVSLVSKLEKDLFHLRTFTQSTFMDTRNMGMIYPGNRWAMIISADQHNLVIDDETNTEPVAEKGIEHLEIGTDFIINE